MNDIRKGKVIIYEDQPYVVVSADFLRKQQRRPVMRTILKHLRTGKTREHSFQQADKIDEANIERRAAQFLYMSEGKYVFMDNETFEQLELGSEVVGEAANYLLENQVIDVVLFEGNPLVTELPVKIERRVIETAPGVRGDTSSSSVMKEAVIEGNRRVKVPLFVNEGDVIRIDTRNGDYVERV